MSTQGRSAALPEPAQIATTMASALEVADAAAADTVRHLEFVQRARLSQLQRQAATLVQRLGSKDPRAIAAENAVTTGKLRVARLSAISAQAATPTPVVSDAGWVLHGRVFDAQLAPAAQLTVFLVDGSKTYQRQYGFAYTDATGYFSIVFTGAAGDASQAEPLFIEITDRKGQPIYLGAAAFKPVVGSATYQDIELSTGDKPIGTPPQVIRESARPAARKKR